MNTEPETISPPDLPGLLGSASTPQDEALAKLEEQIESLRDALREERFCWILLCIILFDTAIFASVKTTGVPIAIVLLEIGFLVVLAKKLGVEQIVRLVDRIIDGWSKRGGPSDPPEN